MYKILVVDDEKAIRENIASAVPFESLGFYIAGTAKNGQEAFDKLPEVEPDLILLDVNMPVVDGITFLELLRKSAYKDVKVIMLSGYNDFQYAQKAIRYNAKAYLTKPIDDEEAVKILAEIHQQLDREKSNKDGDLMSRSREQYNKFYDGGRGSYEVLANFVLMYCVLLKDDDSATEHAMDIQREVMDEHFGRNQYTLIRSRGSIFTYLVPLATIFERHADCTNCGRRLAQKMHLKGLNPNFLFDMTMFDGSHSNFRSDSTDHFYQMLTSIFYGQEDHCQYDKESRPSVYNELTSKKAFLENYKRYLSEKDYKRIREDFEGLIAELHDTRQELQYVYEISFRIYYLIKDVLNEMIGEGNYEEILFPEWRDFQRFEDFDGWKQRERAQLEEVIRLLKGAGMALGKGTHQEILQYIHYHYRESISIKSISRHFHLNPAYVGRMFKRTVGTSIKQYINGLRMEEAKRLLMSTDMMVYEIAAEVGFSESKYFVTRFTEQEGISPAQFRKQKNH